MTPQMPDLKHTLKNRQFTLGSWITLGHPSIAEILVGAGYEWIVVDNEHSMMSLEAIQSLIATAQGKGGKALVRLSHNHASEVRKILDAGADGVICPMINSAEDARRLLDECKYPPVGKRSYGLTRAQGYGATATDYFQNANDRTIVIAQLEHIRGVERIDEILDQPGIDGVITGPYDLSGSLNLPGQLTHPKVIEAERRVLDACAKRGIACGAHLVQPTPESIRAKLDLGYSFLALGTDFFYLGEGARQARAVLKELQR